MLVIIISSFTAGSAMNAAASDVKRISTQALSKMLRDPDVIVLDVRTKPDWEKSDAKIKGAVREDPGNVSFWLATYPSNKTLVFYCA